MGTFIKSMICIAILVMSFSFIEKPEYATTPAPPDNGMVIKMSALDFETTYNKLKNIIEANPNLTILLEIDHSANAKAKGIELRPTRMIIFGNPLLGTPLMKSKASVALDLPQKILVYQLEDGTVEIGYNDPFYLKERHEFEGQDELLEKISNALSAITDKAIAK